MVKMHKMHKMIKMTKMTKMIKVIINGMMKSDKMQRTQNGKNATFHIKT